MANACGLSQGRSRPPIESNPSKHRLTDIAKQCKLKLQSPSACRSMLKDADGRSPLAGPDELPLLGKRIIITAPRQYSQKLCAKLVNAGARPLVVPAVQITELPPKHQAQMQADLQRLLLRPHAASAAAAHNAISTGEDITSTSTNSTSSGGPCNPSSSNNRIPCPSSPSSSSRDDEGGEGEGQGRMTHITHIAFTSRNGIFAFLDALSVALGGASCAVEWLRRSSPRLCALGADGEVLRGLGLEVHVAPQEASTQGLVRELVARGEAAGARVLCPVPLVAGGLVEPPVVPRFLRALQDAGATPLRLPAYLTSPGSTPLQCAPEVELLRAGHVDAVAFSSTAEAQGLVQLVGGTAVLADAVRQHGVLLAAHGPYTAEGVRAVLAGLEVGVVSKNFSSFDGLVAALEEHFATRKGER